MATSPFHKGKISTDGGVFLKLEADAPIDAVILSTIDEMVSFDQHALWREEGRSPIFPCIRATGQNCPGCAQGDTPRFRAVIPVYLRDEKVIKVWSFGIRVAKALQNLDEALGSVKGQLVRIKRTGTGLKTEYAVISLGKKFNTDKLEKDIPDIIGLLGPTDEGEIIALINGEDVTEERVKSTTKAKPNGRTPDAKKDEVHEEEEESGGSDPELESDGGDDVEKMLESL